MMKTKIMLIMALCLMMLCQVASAEKYDYKDPGYDFKQVKTIYLDDMNFLGTNLSPVREASLDQDYKNRAADKTKLAIMSGDSLIRKISLAQGMDMDLMMKQGKLDEVEKLWDEHMGDYIDAYVDVTLEQFSTHQEYHPEYTTWETRKEKVGFRDHNGKRVEIWEERQYPVYHEAYYSTAFDIKVQLSVYDAKTSKVIFQREDVRTRDYEDEGKDMFARICNDFFNDFRKLTK